MIPLDQQHPYQHDCGTCKSVWPISTKNGIWQTHSSKTRRAQYRRMLDRFTILYESHPSMVGA
eukprot:4759548-Prorocentrum_lima.AAC.1